MITSCQHITEKSKYHESNEDSLFIGDDIIIIADGMGGESNGSMASKIAVDTISKLLNGKCIDVVSYEDAKFLILSAIKEADRNIQKYVDCYPDAYGMGTTILIMMLHAKSISLGWCGDSRCYAYGDKGLLQLTKDHSFVQELIDAKEITAEESLNHPDSNLITRYVGGGEDMCVPDYAKYELNDVRTILLCSDGLSGYCNDSSIETVLSTNRDCEKLPGELMNLAISHGSDDDITIVCYNPRHKRSSIFNWFSHK